MIRKLVYTLVLALAFIGALLSGGCTERVTVETTLVSASKKAYVIDVKTQPGLKAEAAGITAEANENGVARLTIPIKRLGYAKDMHAITVMVKGDSLFTDYFGQAEVMLPFTPKEAEKLSDASHWLKIQGERSPGERSKLSWDLGDAGGVIAQIDGSVIAPILAPPGATVTLLGKTVTVDSKGNGQLKFSAAEIRKRLSAAVFTSKAKNEPTALTATMALKGGDTQKIKLEEKWYSHGAGKALKRWIESLKQTPIPGSRETKPLVLFLDSQDTLHAKGRMGPVTTVDIVASATAKPPKKMSPCSGYVLEGSKDKTPFDLPRQGIDEEVVAFDAHTGQELGRRVFEAMDHCPIEKRDRKSKLEVRPNEDEVLNWALEL